VTASLASWLLRSPGRAALVAAAAGFLVAAAAGFLVLPTGIMFTAWAPGAVLACLVFAGKLSPRWVPASLIAAGIPLAWALGQGVGTVIGAGLAAAVLLPTVALSAWLRRTNSLSYTVQTAAVAGILAVIGAHLVVDDSKAFWQPVVVGVEQMLQQMGGAGEEAHEIAEVAGQVAWGGAIWLVTLYSLLGVFFGLHLFGRSRDTHELGPRFRALKVGRVLAVLAVIAWALTAWRVAREADDVLYVLLGMFLLQGLALVHAIRESFGVGGWTLVLFYILLFLLSALVLPVLVMLGLVDNWLDFRGRWGRPRAPAG